MMAGQMVMLEIRNRVHSGRRARTNKACCSSPTANFQHMYGGLGALAQGQPLSRPALPPEEIIFCNS
jgi:hypothetical protein